MLETTLKNSYCYKYKYILTITRIVATLIYSQSFLKEEEG